MELPINTPTSWQSTSWFSSIACTTACCAATSANCEERLMRLSSLLSKYWLSSYPRTTAPIFDCSPENILPSNVPTPECPAVSASQNSVTLQPNGLASPIPVTTTRSVFRDILNPLIAANQDN